MSTLIADFLFALLCLGLPLAAASWFLFSWLFNNGDLDRDLDSEALKKSIKKLKKSAISVGKNQSKTRFIYDKWMWFGSGFYGLAGLWTFAVIELTQFIEFLFSIGSWGEMFNEGLVSFLIDFLLNQLGNMLQGLVWFTYWPADSMLLWVLVAFLGYRLGLQAAKQGMQLAVLTRWQEQHFASLPAWLQRVLQQVLSAGISRRRDNSPDT
jgi:hypothetical protein